MDFWDYLRGAMIVTNPVVAATSPPWLWQKWQDEQQPEVIQDYRVTRDATQEAQSAIEQFARQRGDADPFKDVIQGYVGIDDTVAKGLTRKPTYLDGMELTQWYGWGAEQKKTVKQKLYYAGFYGDTIPEMSEMVNAEDVEAMAKAMTVSNMNPGTTWDGVVEPRYRSALETGRPYTQAPPSPADVGKEAGALDAAITALRQFLDDNGVTMPETEIATRARSLVDGAVTTDTLFADMREKVVTSAFPAYREFLKAGADMRDVAAPYVGAMSQILEIPETEITLKDPILRKALQSVDAQGQPTQLPVWQWEDELKNDTRWQYTDNAWDEIGSQAASVMSMFGLGGGRL